MHLKVIAAKFNGANCNFPNPNFAILTDNFKLLSRLALKTGQNSCVHALVPFLPRNSNRAKISFVLVFNLPRFRPISMGQMAV